MYVCITRSSQINFTWIWEVYNSRRCTLYIAVISVKL